MEISSAWARSLEPTILEWAHNGFMIHPDTTTEVFNILDKSQGIYRFQDSWGARLIPNSTEGAATTELNAQLGYHTTVSPQIFKGKVSASSEFARWTEYGAQILNQSKDLGEAAINTLNLKSNGVFIKAFSAYTSYGDAVRLASTAHTRPDGGSNQSNADSSGITLTEPNLETGIIALKQQKSGVGGKLAIGSGLLLMVPENLEKEAVIITGSTKRSATANNDLNWYLGRVNTYVNPFIDSDTTDLDGSSGSATAWFLLAQGQHGLTFIWDKRPMYRSWEDEDTDSMYVKIYFSCQTAWQTWRGFWGSKGDGAGYSS